MSSPIALRTTTLPESVAMWQLHLHRYQGLPPALVFDDLVSPALTTGPTEGKSAGIDTLPKGCIMRVDGGRRRMVTMLREVALVLVKRIFSS